MRSCIGLTNRLNPIREWRPMRMFGRTRCRGLEMEIGFDNSSGVTRRVFMETLGTGAPRHNQKTILRSAHCDAQ